MGKTADVPYLSPLETKQGVRSQASTADDAKVDLAQWSYEGETDTEAKARQVLRRFAARWWAYYQVKQAREWLKGRGHIKKDVEAVEDGIRRIKAVSYWSWVRGSQLFFWKYPRGRQIRKLRRSKYCVVLQPSGGLTNK